MIQKLILSIKRGDTAPLRFIKSVAHTVLHNSMPVPAVLRPVFRFAYHAHFGTIFAVRWMLSFFYRAPIFQARCASVGKSLHVWLLPQVKGPVEIHLGDNVNLFGFLQVESSWLCGERPKLEIGNRVDLGHNLLFVINRGIVIEDDVKIASAVRILDTDDYSADPAVRLAKGVLTPDDAKPIRICRYAWIAQNTYILKGITIGEGAIVGVNSVVTSDIPAYSVAMGNPARVVVKNIGRTVAPEAVTQV